MLFSTIDSWVGRTLFIPPIIKLCQLTRQSQFAVARLFWFLTALDGFWHAETLFSSLLWGGMILIMMFTAARRADSPTQSLMFFRMLSLTFFIVSLIGVALSGTWAGAEFWVFVLIAEYAATIRTVPPAAVSKAAKKATNIS